MKDGSGPSVLVIGIDAACSSVVNPLIEDGVLPNLASLFEEGTVGPLESQMPPWTPSAWPSIYTGVNPGKHGVFGFLDFDGYEWEVVDHDDVDERTLWELLDEHGRTSVVVNVPVTSPPRSIDGAIIPGYTAPENPNCHPSGLLDDIREAIGDYQVYAPEPTNRDERVAGYRQLTRMRGQAFRYLQKRFDPDFGFVQFQQTDTVFHELPGDESAVREVYATVDDEVGRILDSWEPDIVLVVSDHGMGRYDGYEFRVNDFLHEQGYVETVSGGEGMPSWSSIARTRLRNGEPGDRHDESRMQRLFAALGSAGLTSQRIGRTLKAVKLDGLALRLAPTSAVRAAAEQVSFAESRAYMRDRIECGVRVNLVGREPEGVVPTSEYEDVRDDLIALLSDVETPDGEPVFERVARREEVFDGPSIDQAPDVVVVPTDFDQYLSASLLGETFGPPSEPYNHKFDGLMAVTGRGINAEVAIEDVNLLDVAPTVLSAMGVPLSDRMDGETVPVVDPTPKATYAPREALSTVCEREEDVLDTNDSAGEAVERRLADLGYIE